MCVYVGNDAVYKAISIHYQHESEKRKKTFYTDFWLDIMCCAYTNGMDEEREGRKKAKLSVVLDAVLSKSRKKKKAHMSKWVSEL